MNAGSACIAVGLDTRSNDRPLDAAPSAGGHADAADLVRTARAALLDSLAPLLGADQRYAVAMIANALAVAERAIADGGKAHRDDLSRVFWLIGGSRPDGGDPRRALAAAIRRGDFDPDGPRAADRERLRGHLRASVIARLAIDNPKRLATR